MSLGCSLSGARNDQIQINLEPASLGKISVRLDFAQDGRVSAVLGTHTHVQTADEQIFPGGTAFMCDAGMCGPINSILGRAIEPIMNRFISNMPASFPVAAGEVRLRGALIEIDERT